MSIQEQVVEELKTLSVAELEKVAQYLAFLKFSTRQAVGIADEEKLAALYAEFAEEDRQLAEAGLADYAEGLLREDAA